MPASKMTGVQKRYVCAVDIGNSNICLALFFGRRILTRRRIVVSKKNKKVDTIKVQKILKPVIKNLSRKYPKTVYAVASVVPPLNVPVKKIIRHISKSETVFLDRDIPIPIANRYRRKKEVGADRLVNGLAAYKTCRKKCLVIDFGTAVTFDFVSTKGAYLGGMIFPGINVSLSALSDLAELLPAITLRKARGLIAKDTVTSMQSGICYGYGALCDGMREHFQRKYGKAIGVIATGGQAGLISKFCSKKFNIDSDLTVKGICEAYLIARSCGYSLFD